MCGPGHPPLLGSTVGHLMNIAADTFGDREGVVDVHQKIRKTFWELRSEIDHLAAGFVEMGLKPGDRVGIWGPNSYEWYLTQFAAARAGLVLVSGTKWHMKIFLKQNHKIRTTPKVNLGPFR